MNELQLSKRLKLVADFVLQGSKLADIGSDHAYLPCYLALQGKIDVAIAGEVNEGPYLSAKNQVEKLALQSRIKARKGNGLQVVEAGEVDVITICGMGGSLITTILEQGKEKLERVKRLILQPNVSADKVRQWLLENGWQLVEERIVEEDEKIYEILVADKGEPMTPYEGKLLSAAILLGPFLMLEKNDAFQKKWKSEMENWKRILHQFVSAKQSLEVDKKKEELEQMIAIVEEVLK